MSTTTGGGDFPLFYGRLTQALGHPYEASEFLYPHDAPWPEASFDYPYGQAPQVMIIPAEEMDDWSATIGRYYKENAVGSVTHPTPFGVASLKFARANFFDNGMTGYAPLSDEDFVADLRGPVQQVPEPARPAGRGAVRPAERARGPRRRLRIFQVGLPTYVGALPGRIIQGLRRAGSNNPVFMLDEIDKVGSDFRGDPSSALLEVLDPEQHKSFSDHYLDVAFDLSRVLFIATANVLDTIPAALRDRMEVLSLVGYTLDEKLKIAHRYLIPRQREEHGLSAKMIQITSSAVRQIISGYTREAGLRNLEREIASICRGAASKIAQGRVKAVKVGLNELRAYIGPVRFTEEVKARVLGAVLNRVDYRKNSYYYSQYYAYEYYGEGKKRTRRRRRTARPVILCRLRYHRGR